MSGRTVAAVLEPRFLAWGALWSVVALLAFGLVLAIIPNPIFGREIAPEPFAIATWIASAPLIGLLVATYHLPPTAGWTEAVTLHPSEAPAGPDRSGSTVASLGGAAALLAIGCPLCNKLVLLLLGASGAMSIFAPMQPVIGAASLVVLAGTLAWRMRLRARGEACAPRRAATRANIGSEGSA